MNFYLNIMLETIIIYIKMVNSDKFFKIYCIYFILILYYSKTIDLHSFLYILAKNGKILCFNFI